MQIVSIDLHECQILFSGYNQKKYFKMSAENFTQSTNTLMSTLNVLKFFYINLADKMAPANYADPDQIAPVLSRSALFAPEGALWSGSALFAILINPCPAESIKKPHPFLIFCQSDYLIKVVDIDSYT